MAVTQDPNLHGKFRSGSDVVVAEGQTVSDDLYASAGRVEVAGRVRGDVVASGGEVEIRGTVTGDLLAAAGRVTITGDVRGDIRAAGGRVSLSGATGEDVVVTGGQITVADSGRIGGDLVFSGGRVTMDGRVAGSVLGSAGRYDRGGSVGGDEEVMAGPVSQAPTAGERAAAAVRRYVAVLAVGLLLLWFAPAGLRSAAERARQRPLFSAGAGILGLLGFVLLLLGLVIVTALVTVLLGLLGLGSLAATVIVGGVLAAAAATFALLVVVLFVADAAVGLGAGRLLLRSEHRGSTALMLAALAVGVALVVAATSIPLLGGWVRLLVVLVGAGAVVRWLRARGRARGDAVEATV
ncbi:MAG TPA: hypothetical protein VHF25_02035 [Nitriliruptorales bacterium]|nr:hypothetical protein [Nitriliruptorales bacterium]